MKLNGTFQFDETITFWTINIYGKIKNIAANNEPEPSWCIANNDCSSGPIKWRRNGSEDSLPSKTMDLNLIEPHPCQVLEAFRHGEFDVLDIIEQTDVKEFFELCLRKPLLENLAESLPTAREKKDVASW